MGIIQKGGTERPDWLREVRPQGLLTLRERVDKLPPGVMAAASKIRQLKEITESERALLTANGVDPKELENLVSAWGSEEGPSTRAYVEKVIKKL